MTKKNSDQLFTDLLLNDRIGKPSKAIEDRLMYSFMLKNSRMKTKQNSFGHFFSWLFSSQSLAIKTGLVSVILFVSLMNNQINIGTGTISPSDTIFAKRVLVADSTSFIQSIDSLRTDSLN